MFNRIFQLILTHPLTRHVDLDSPETTVLRSRIIQEKPFLKQFYHECCLSIAESLPAKIDGPVLELGSGAGFLKQYIPNLLTSEILKMPEMDIILDGTCLPFSTNCLKGIVMINVFHHIANIANFLSDATKCIKPGGVIIMIEPWSTPWSRFVYCHLHHEPFEPEVEGWKFPAGGPLSQANSALPWIVFERDQMKFEKKFFDLQVKEIMLNYPFCYFLSGGVSLRSLIPGCMYKVIRKIEKLAQPWMNSLAMFAKIVIERKMAARDDLPQK